MSPSWARLARSFSSPASSSLPPRTLPRYCVRTSCASIIATPLSASFSELYFRRPAPSRRRVRPPDPGASVRHETVQDAPVQARRDPPLPSARALKLEAPPLAHLGHGRLLEGAQATRRQRPHVDLPLRLADRDERGIGPESASPLASPHLARSFSAHLRSPS